MASRSMVALHDGVVLIMDSASQITGEDSSTIIVCGSHGAKAVARHMARYQPFGVICNDAGRGKNDAGIDGLPVFDAMNIIGATVDAMTARIGDGKDNFESGTISAVNSLASAAGIAIGMTTRDALLLMLKMKKAQADTSDIPVHEMQEGSVVVMDSISAVMKCNFDNKVIVAGSHCADIAYVVCKKASCQPRGVILNDAGRGKDGHGISALSMFHKDKIPAAAVDCNTAMIGDGLDMWASGIISQPNGTAEGIGIVAGMTSQQTASVMLQ